MDIIKGTPWNDLLEDMLSQYNKFIGKSGDDVILFTNSTRDVKADGNSGNDYIDAGLGDDELNGGSGDDYLVGNDGDDRLSGGSGMDSLIGGNGVDILKGGSGNDFLFDMAGENFLDGGSGNDAITGGSDSDVIKGGSGDDTILDISGNNNINAGSGDDRIGYGVGNDTVVAGSGHDTLVDNGFVGDDVVHLNSGNDTIQLGGGNDIIYGGSGNDTFLMSATALRAPSIVSFTVQQNREVEYVNGVFDPQTVVVDILGFFGIGALGPINIDTNTIIGGSGQDTYVVESLESGLGFTLTGELIIEDFDQTGGNADLLDVQGIADILQPDDVTNNTNGWIESTADGTTLDFALLMNDPADSGLTIDLVGVEGVGVDDFVFGAPALA